MKDSIKYLFFLALLTGLNYSCKKENFTTDSAAKLSFSTDTVMFDTVFTTIGSATKQFKIYNRNNQYIKVSSIYLANAANSHFRLNINGTHAAKVENIEIPPKDSLFVFVEVTLNPANLNNPLEIVDSIVCVVNGNVQDVKLVAFGQDVYLVNGRTLRNDTVWNGEKPILVYNSMLLDSNRTLTINRGTKIYFHRNSSMYVKGKIIVNGTKDLPVIFRNDRLEHDYDNISSQWSGIVLFSGSFNNVINYAEIKNGVIGLQVGNIENLCGASVVIKNTKIENMSYACVFSIASAIDAYNCVFANGAFYTTAIVVGGSYSFYNTTFADYAGSGRSDPSVVISNNLEYDNNIYLGNLVKADFGNCIIYGNSQVEMGLSNKVDADFNYKFDHCLLKLDATVNINDAVHFNTIYKNLDPLFKSTSDKLDFQLEVTSPAIDKGSDSIVNAHFQFLQYDLNGVIRTNSPELGAYEKVE